MDCLNVTKRRMEWLDVILEIDGIMDTQKWRRSRPVWGPTMISSCSVFFGQDPLTPLYEQRLCMMIFIKMFRCIGWFYVTRLQYI